MIFNSAEFRAFGPTKRYFLILLSKLLVFSIFGFVIFAILPQKTLAVSISDNFNRADGGLGSNWTTMTGTDAPQIVSNVLEAGTNNTVNAAFWTANSFASDQYVQAKMPATTGSTVGPGIAVRMANSSGYFLWGNGNNTVSIYRMDNATTWVTLATSSTLTISNTDEWKLIAKGSTITGYQNGTPVVTATDSTYTTGSPGVWMYYTSNQIDDWSGGDDFYTVGGTVSELSGTVVLQNNGENLSASSSGAFTFTTKTTPGDTYDVTIKTYPTGQICTVSNGSGTIISSNITNVSVTCTNNSATSASDDFNRADGPLGPNWTDLPDGGLTISSQEVSGANGTFGDFRSEETYTSNQYSEIEVSSTPLSGSEWIGPTVRTQSNGDLYVGLYDWNNGSPYVQIFKRISGAWTGFNSYSIGALAAGTKIRLEAIGSTLVLYVDGVERVTAYDTSLTGGAPGIMAYQAATADNWSGGDAPDFAVDYLSTDANGVETYDVISETNGPGAQLLRVLRPTNPVAGVKHNFIYTLPVTAGYDTSYGDGLDTLRSLNAQNQYNLTVIEPTFGVEPWYADNPNNTDALQETYLTTQIVPWVKAYLATTGYEQSWLIGFSKSGIGGIDLLLKHPDLFTLGGMWDFPADMSTYNQFDPSSTNEYGTDANFQTNYRLSSTNLDKYKSPFVANNRIWIGSYSLYGTDMSDFDTLLTTEGIKHTTETPTSMNHRWDSGWVPLALTALYQESINLPDTTAPTVTTFTVPSTSNSVTIPISAFSAKDDTGVTGYIITESANKPAASEGGWSTSAPTSYTSSICGNITLYGWAKDAAGNVSLSLTAPVDITASCTATSSSSSNQPNPNIIIGWHSVIMQGPHFVGDTHFISLGDAQTLLPRQSVHDDVTVSIKQTSFADLLSAHIPFPWMQGLNTDGDIYNFSVVSAFNGYPIRQFDKPVIIILPYNPTLITNSSQYLEIAAYDPHTKKWNTLPNSVFDPIDHTIATTTKKFTYFVVVSPAKQTQPVILNRVLAASAQNITFLKKPASFIKTTTTTSNKIQKKHLKKESKKTCILFICF